MAPLLSVGHRSRPRCCPGGGNGSTVSVASKSRLRCQAPGRSTAAGATYVLALATVAPPLAESEAESAEIAANPSASASFWALVPKMEAICGDGLIFPREGQPAEVQGNLSEAAEGIRTLDLLHGKQTL